MGFKIKKQGTDDADIDVTAFMNLMIVLVPVLLLSMTFTKVTVMDINLPELTGGGSSNEESQSQLEIVVKNSGIEVFYPSGTLIKTVPLKETPTGEVLDFKMLSMVMQEIKKQLGDKRDALILSAGDIDYQSLVSAMDAVKSYKAVVAASLVEVELFPLISLGDASK